MKVTICDRCGQQVGDNAGRFLTHIKNHAYTTAIAAQPEEFDLCHACSDEIRTHIFNFSDSLQGSKINE